MPTDWLEVILECNDAESEGYKLLELGFGGAEVVSPTTLRCFIQDKALIHKAQQVGFQIKLCGKSDQTKWHAKCEELWQPVTIGSFTVQPIPSRENIRNVQLKHNEVLLIPGLGFGTGHHTATRLCAEMQQRVSIRNKDARILDFGTGSGLLAILAAKQFNATVEAIDIDPLAIENARENVEINGLTERIKLITGGIEACSGQYDLIIANLYAELLCQFQTNFSNLLKSNYSLIVSGIAQPLGDSVLSTYCSPRWQKIESLNQNEWWGFAFKRVPDAT